MAIQRWCEVVILSMVLPAATNSFILMCCNHSSLANLEVGHDHSMELFVSVRRTADRITTSPPLPDGHITPYVPLKHPLCSNTQKQGQH